MTILVFGIILYTPKVSGKNLANISDFRIKSSLLAQVDKKEAIIYFHRGINRHTSGDIKGAIEEYNQALKLRPDFAEVYYKRGISRYKLGDLKVAANLFQKQKRISNYQEVIDLINKLPDLSKKSGS